MIYGREDINFDHNYEKLYQDIKSKAYSLPCGSVYFTVNTLENCSVNIGRSAFLKVISSDRRNIARIVPVKSAIKTGFNRQLYSFESFSDEYYLVPDLDGKLGKKFDFKVKMRAGVLYHKHGILYPYSPDHKYVGYGSFEKKNQTIEYGSYLQKGYVIVWKEGRPGFYGSNMYNEYSFSIVIGETKCAYRLCDLDKLLISKDDSTIRPIKDCAEDYYGSTITFTVDKSSLNRLGKPYLLRKSNIVKKEDGSIVMSRSSLKTPSWAMKSCIARGILWDGNPITIQEYYRPYMD